MERFIKVCAIIGFSLALSLFVSACISSFHAEKIDWKTGETIEYENNND